MTERRCGWCKELLRATARADAEFCSKKCRQTAFRLHRRRGEAVSLAPGGAPFAYADPPYPKLARKYYQHEPTFAGEVDHRELVASLTAAGYMGWALSTSRDALRDVLPLCPPEARVYPWVKPIGVRARSYGPHNAWEPLIVVGGRLLRPGFRDWLRAQPARGGGTLMGRKPVAFCAFLFRCMGMLPGDELVDLFPGTGVVTRAWQEVNRRSSRNDGSRRRVARVLQTDQSPAAAGGPRQLSLLQERRVAEGAP